MYIFCVFHVSVPCDNALCIIVSRLRAIHSYCYIVYCPTLNNICLMSYARQDHTRLCQDGKACGLNGISAVARTNYAGMESIYIFKYRLWSCDITNGKLFDGFCIVSISFCIFRDIKFVTELFKFTLVTLLVINQINNTERREN